MRILLLILLFSIPLSISQALQAQEVMNAGFVQGIWYSETTVFAGDELRIYSAIQNRSGSDIVGLAEFFIDGESIGQPDFSAVDGKLFEIWADWTATEGNHTVEAKVIEVREAGIGEELKLISINSAAAQSSLFVDYDTDDDGIGNNKDTDDDNDGVSDAVEIEAGSDPLDSASFPKESSALAPLVDLVNEITDTEKRNAIGETATRVAAAFIDTGNKVSETVVKRLEDTKDKLEFQRQEKEESSKYGAAVYNAIINSGIFLVSFWQWVLLSILILYLIVRMRRRATFE